MVVAILSEAMQVNVIRICLLLTVLGFSLNMGCARTLQQNFEPPGTIFQQKLRARLHDPYPSDDLGPPLVGVRPREFNQPYAEARDSQILPKGFERN